MAQKFNEIINNSSSIAICAHSNPDADAIASSVATKRWIEQNYKNKEVHIFLTGEIGELYKPLIADEKINPIENNEYDLAIVLDCPSIERTGNEDIINRSKVIVNIDHHETNDKFGDYRVIAPICSSTGELLYLIFASCQPVTDKKIAELIYHSIITDTVCFSSISMSKRTHSVLEKLLEFDFDANAIKQHYFENMSKSKLFLIKKALNSMKFYCNDRVSLMRIKKQDFENSGADFTDTLGIVENGIKIEGVDIALIVIEKEENEYYISLRSKNGANVGEIARSFDGGGHQNMAALQYTGENIAELERNILKECDQMLETIPCGKDDFDF